MRWRIGSITGAMIGIAGLAALLAVEAARAARIHQYTAERVLLDYASLGAEGVGNRLRTFLSVRLFPILIAIGEPPAPSRTTFASGLQPAAAELGRHVLWTGRMAPTGPLRAVRYDSSAVIGPGLADSIRQASARLADAAYYGLLPSGENLVVFAPIRGTARSHAVYALPLAPIRAALESHLREDPVLPPALTHGEPVGPGVSVILSICGRRLAERGASNTTRFRSADTLGPMFGNMSVEVGLAESLASALVIGGLPRSRLPFLVAVMGLTLVLALAAAFQLRQKERLARLREDFVAGASHELRTPLAQIRLFAETLRLERVRSDDERSRAVTVIEREARRLEHLVENLLHFSRAERGTLRLALEAADLAVVTREIVGEFHPLAEKAGAVIRVEGPESLPAKLDPGAWRQIVLNLLDNAVKYGGPGGITVSVGREGSRARVSVADQGPGVPDEDRERIWERFWRGNVARSAGISGTGIGLATVRDLVTLHGGECRVERAEPRGARFVITLPEDV
jgi:signal transduction histidine kinase